MKHPTLSVDKDNINPKNIESLRAGRRSITQPNLLVENNIDSLAPIGLINQYQLIRQQVKLLIK